MTRLSLLALVLLALTYPSKGSATGRKPASRLTEHQRNEVKKIRKMLPRKLATEVAALGLVESGLKPLVSTTKDYGPMQINCRVWRRLLQTHLNIADCEKEVMDLNTATRAAVFILKRLRRKYSQCKDDKVYSCYNGGQGWAVVRKRCMKRCGKRDCNHCDRPILYAQLIRQTKKLLRARYSVLLQ